MKYQIAVITVELNGRKRFVKLGDKRDDQKIIMEYTDKADDATEFEDEHEALLMIPIIHNPFERALGTGTVTIDSKPYVPLFSGSLK